MTHDLVDVLVEERGEAVPIWLFHMCELWFIYACDMTHDWGEEKGEASTLQGMKQGKFLQTCCYTSYMQSQ